MAHLTQSERNAVLILFKDFLSYYNANSLSKKLGISRVGTMQMLKKLEKQGLLTSSTIGKSTVYKPNLDSDYVRDLIAFLLSDEAQSFRRWKEEFRELFKNGRVVLLYGSTAKNYQTARDIDVMILRKKNESAQIHRVISERQEYLPKKIHAIDMTPKEFQKNIKIKQKAMIDVVKNAIVLYGQAEYVELIHNVTRR